MTEQTISHQQNLIQQSQGRMGRPDYLGSQRNSCWHLDSCFISPATNPKEIWGTSQLVVGRRLLTEEAAQLVLARTANNTQSIRFVTASLFQEEISATIMYFCHTGPDLHFWLLQVFCLASRNWGEQTPPTAWEWRLSTNDDFLIIAEYIFSCPFCVYCLVVGIQF